MYQLFNEDLYCLLCDHKKKAPHVSQRRAPGKKMNKKLLGYFAYYSFLPLYSTNQFPQSLVALVARSM